MADPIFTHDVFLSHSSKDKPVVRELAERLREGGVRVWLDEWEIKPGDSIPAKVEEGLENSRILILCMSANAFGSDWATLESYTFRFRDPLNKERRFLPLRLDDAPIKGSLAQFLYLSWKPDSRDASYPKLLESCRPPANPIEDEEATSDPLLLKSIQLDYEKPNVLTYAFHKDGKRALIGNTDGMIWVLDIESEACLKVLEGHTSGIWSVVWSPDGKRALSGSGDSTVRLWDIEAGICVKIMYGHKGYILGLAWHPDGKHALSSDDYGVVRFWNIETGKCIRILKNHEGFVRSVAWRPDGDYAVSGDEGGDIRIFSIKRREYIGNIERNSGWTASIAWISDGNFALFGNSDRTISLLDMDTGNCIRILEGHKKGVTNVAWSPDEKHAISGSDDRTVRLWDMETGICLKVLGGHSDEVLSVGWSPDGKRAFSGDRLGKVCVWDLSGFVGEEKIEFTIPAQVQYINAKVLLVGESGVGKTGLSNFLAHNIKVEDEKPLPSTDGAWATHWPLTDITNKAGVKREAWLWDFAGQVDYRLVHQLFMDGAAVAALVFNPQNENLFEGLGHWDRDLQKATNLPFKKLLVAGRTDRGGLIVSDESVRKFIDDNGFTGGLHLTSAKTGAGCDILRDAIIEAIDWQSIPEWTSPTLYHRMKQEILALRDKGLVLIRLAELKQRLEVALSDEPFTLEELSTVVELLAGQGMIQKLYFGGFILLRPEVLSRYAAAVVRKVRQQQMGCLPEKELLDGDLDYQDFVRLPAEDEAVVLRALLETFVSRAWCLRQPCDGDSALLTFPSYFRRERKDQPSHPSVLVTYRFDGPTDDIYATLVVRLHHTVAFESFELWRSAADFKTQTGAKLGFTLRREREGTSCLEVYFEPDVEENSRLVFLRYVHDHLVQHAQNVVRLRRYFCANRRCEAFEQPFTEQHRIDRALAPGGKGKVFCSVCGKPIVLKDTIETKFESLGIKEHARQFDAEAQGVIDNESRELMAVHHTGFIVSEAGQIYRGYTNSDHGIDGEIEFKDNEGRASGKRLYVQLKSGDSYLKTRQRDGAEIFQIKSPRWADYWRQQAYPVLLVVRTSDGEIRWMDVTAYLKRASAGGRTVTQIVFDGERLDVMSVRRWRDRALSVK